MSRKAPRMRNDSKLARVRIARGLTQAQLAAMVGCAQEEISRYERGMHTMGGQRLAQIARALECRIEDIIELSEQTSLLRF